jgi:hypothetical protein
MILSAKAISVLSAPFLSDEQADKRTITAAIAAAFATIGKSRIIYESVPLAAKSRCLNRQRPLTNPAFSKTRRFRNHSVPN